MAATLPQHAQVVIIGGGIVGCSVAYHLTQLGWRDILLLEQYQLTAGTTWHAAGLVGQLRNTRNLTQMALYGVELYSRLEAETGLATGFKQNGALTLAQTADRFTELKRHAAMAGQFGVECHVIDAQEVKRLWPLAEVSDLQGAIWLPKDGQTNPTDTTQALAKGARNGGAKIIENVQVERIVTRNGRACGVVVGEETIQADYVVLCAGMWSRSLAAAVGAAIPLHACEHMYVVTEALEGVAGDTPVLRDYDNYLYLKEDAGKLLVGIFEPDARPWGMDGIPDNHAFGMLNEDWDHFAPYMEGAMHRVPLLETAGIRQFLNGAESFTPDTRYMLGETAEVGHLFVATGFNSIGIASAAGAGKALAEWMVGGAMPMDLWDIDVRRFQPFQANAAYLQARVPESLGNLYAMHWPYYQNKTARNVRKTPFYDRMAAEGAFFGETAGWERPLWYAGRGETPVSTYSYGAQDWWPRMAAEAKATREAVALYELSAFAKFRLVGADAEANIQRIATNNFAVPPGRTVYTQMLNEKGGIETDLTISRISDEEYFIVTGAAVGVHDYCWIRDHIEAKARVDLSDVTAQYAVLGLMGPQSRAVLQAVTTTDLANAQFPFATHQWIQVGSANVLAVRVSYVGELGYELYIPTDFALAVFDTLQQAGVDYDLRLAGLQAQDALRLEKAFKHWGHDIGPEDTPLEAGLGFACAFDKPGGFIGREALLQQKQEGLRRRLVTLTIDSGQPLMLHEEPIYMDGEPVGTTTSGGYAPTLQQSMTMGYVSHEKVRDRKALLAAEFKVDIAGEKFNATAHLAPPYDPKGLRMRS